MPLHPAADDVAHGEGADHVAAVAGYVGRPVALGEHTLHRRLYGARLLFEAEGVAQHQRHAQYGAYGVGYPLPRYVRRRAVNRLVQRPPQLLGIAGHPAKLADGSMPMEPDNTDASSVSMSPKVFSATTTSK